MKMKLVLLLLGVTLFSPGTIFAHHSFAGTYLLDKLQTIEGRVVQVLIRNPHSFIQVEVKDEKGEPIRWFVEAGGATQMAPQGDKPALKAGDILRVAGNPARSADAHRMRLVRMVRPSDGWNWGNAAGQVVE